MSSPSSAVSQALDRERLALLCKALGHPARIQILEILIRESSCLTGDLSGRLPLAPSTVSQHLKVLREAGLVRGTVDGLRRNYCADPGTLAEVVAELIELTALGPMAPPPPDC